MGGKTSGVKNCRGRTSTNLLRAEIPCRSRVEDGPLQMEIKSPEVIDFRALFNGGGFAASDKELYLTFA